MLKIRMQRIGRKHEPAFRIVVTESTRGPKSGDYVERVGYYYAKTGERKINKERVLYWIQKGAKPSDTVYNFLIDDNLIQGKKRAVTPRRAPVNVKEQAQETQDDDGSPSAGAVPQGDEEGKEKEGAAADEKKEKGERKDVKDSEKEEEK